MIADVYVIVNIIGVVEVVAGNVLLNVVAVVVNKKFSLKSKMKGF